MLGFAGAVEKEWILAAAYYSPELAVAHRQQFLAEANREREQKDSAPLEGFYNPLCGLPALRGSRMDEKAMTILAQQKPFSTDQAG